MTIRTTFRERVCRSISTWNKGFFVLFIFLFSIFPKQAIAQDCPGGIVISISGSTTGQWVAPTDEGPGPWQVQITAKGAGGGSGNGNLGGGGATVIGTFVVQNGEKLFAISGGPGGNGIGGPGGGGGSGSGVVNCSTTANCQDDGVVLIIAAGGNGGEQQGAGLGGSILSAQGFGGNGDGGNGGGGGGGMDSDGTDGSGGSSGGGGGQVLTWGIASGGLGSDNPANNGGSSMGGGGCGGTGNNSGSGGGVGGTGADGGNAISATSFNSGTNPQGTNGGQGTGANSGSVIVTCLGSLPIQLINFKAVINEDNVHLIWSTASEKDNHGFDVERSADNRNWSTLGFMPGNGTTAEKSEYRFTDESPLAGVNYYRLKQMDTDGSFQHTPMVVADVRANTLQFDVFPNPSVNGELNVRTVSQEEGDALLEIYNWAGYKVYKESIHLLKGTMVYPVSLATYPKGAYTARLEMPDGTVQFKKILLQ